jgi:hypothetical protein
MGTCCDLCGKTGWQLGGDCPSCPCHTAPPTARCKTSPLCSHNTNGRDLDKPCSIEVPTHNTERTDEQNKAILDHARPIIEANRRLLGLDTPNTAYERVSHTHCWNNQPSPCGIPLDKHTQCCLCDLPTPNTERYDGTITITKHESDDGTILPLDPRYDDLVAMVRDFCSVVPRSKSEVKRRIEDFIREALATQKSQIIAEVESLTEEIIPIKYEPNPINIQLACHEQTLQVGFNQGIKAAVTKLKGM